MPDRVFGWRDFASGPLRRDLACDVLVIGSGAGGGVIAAELAAEGLDVIVLEEGGYHTTAEFTGESSAMVRKLYRDGGAQLAIGAPPVQFTEGRCVGGSTVVNGGMSWRTPEVILDRWVRTEGMTDCTPAKMDRHFARVEKMITARKQDPGTVGEDNELLKRGAGKLGWETIDNIRNQDHCVGSNNCAFGCPTGAKQSVLLTYVPRALAHGARIYADCKVERIRFHGKRAVGATARVANPNGSGAVRVDVHASAVFVCAGAIQTPVLLARSGVKPPSGSLGKNLSLHPNTKLVAIFDHDVEGWKGVHQAYQVREFHEEGILFAAVNIPPGVLAMSVPQKGAELGELMRDYKKMVIAGVLCEDETTGRVRALPGGVPLVTYALSDRDAARLVRGTALLAELMFTAGARRVLVPFDGVPELRSVDDARRLRDRKVKKSGMEVVTVHMMGTAAAGGDPLRHVCDPWGKVHDAEALYVADASLFPTPIGVNPMETIMALATRNAERFLERRRAWA